MDTIVNRYKSAKTPKGHELRVDEKGNEIIIWYLFWGEYAGVDDHHHMGIARVRAENDGFVIGWLRGIEQQPYKTERVMDLNELFAKIDAEIKTR